MPLPDTSVRYFDSTMSGAPALSGTAGALVGVLDACLVNGFGQVTLNSLVVQDNVASGTVSAGHGFSMIRGANNVSPGVGPVIRVAGATPAALNGDWRLADAPNSTTFSFATDGIANQTATGTITAQRAPAGWTKAYSGTNKAAYARPSPQATAMLLRVDDAPAQFPVILMYESMTDVDTGAGRCPDTGTSYYFGKSSTADTTARAWRVWADHRAIYLLARTDANNWQAGLFFGDLGSYKPGDAYACALIAHPSANATGYLYELAGSSNGARLARSYSQTGGNVALARYSHQRCSSQIGGAGNPYPGIDGAIHIAVVEAWESSTAARGVMPGLWCPVHALNPPDLTLVDNIPQLPGRQLLASVFCNNIYRALIDLTGPWR